MRKRMASSIRKDRSLPKPNQNEPNVEPKLGIARDTPHLARQFRGGWLLWLPDFLKRWIIGGWNHVSCALFGQRPPGTGCCRWVHAFARIVAGWSAIPTARRFKHGTMQRIESRVTESFMEHGCWNSMKCDSAWGAKKKILTPHPVQSVKDSTLEDAPYLPIEELKNWCAICFIEKQCTRWP